MDAAETVNCGSVTVDCQHRNHLGWNYEDASRSSYAGVGVLKSSDKGKLVGKFWIKKIHIISAEFGLTQVI